MARVCVLGSGLCGLITAQVLLADGFDVEIVTRDASPGGVWSRERVYPDMRINKYIMLY
jgi:dimethylaniline monooxygenase (N-oxide forming)